MRHTTSYWGGDFNCILEQGEATGILNFSQALATLIRGLNLKDAWQRSVDRPVYTHYSVAGATRIDRIYATRDLIARKLGIEKIAAAFTDHYAVCLRLTVDVPFVRIGRGFWKMDNTLLDDSIIVDQLRDMGLA